MSTYTQITGRIGTEPEYKLLGDAKDKPAVRLRLAETQRVRTADGWTDGDTTWYTVQAWDHLAMHLADRLRKGQLITVYSHRPVKGRAWIDRNGEAQVDITVTASDVALSMQVDQATAEVR